GDAHAANVFFPKGGDRSPERLVICDWEEVSVGLGANDIARFQLVSMVPHHRRAAAARLAETYLSELRANGVESYAMAAYERDFRLCTLYQIAMSVIDLGTISTSTERGEAALRALLPRVVAAAADLGDISDVLEGLDTPSDGP
ncbi:MAG: oxidoreductase family protein, partial [Dehalococcoidia bacterium]